MPDLAQIVNALLRDVAKARFGSDLYARDVARYYEADGLLRRFPVPRPEIAEVEFDLKFLVDSLQLEPTQHELTEATLATVFEPYCDRIRAEILAVAARGPDDLKKPLATGSAGITLRQAVLKELTESWGRPAQAQAHRDVRQSEAALREIARRFVIEELRPIRQGEAVDAFARSVAKEARLEPLLTALSKELERAAAERGDCRVEVAVAGDRLSQAAPGAISSIRIKAAVRNYVWTQIERPPEFPPEPDEKDRAVSPDAPKVWRSLNAE